VFAEVRFMSHSGRFTRTRRDQLERLAMKCRAEGSRPTFLLNQFGKARTAAGLSTMFGMWCKKVGLPRDAHAHGLRKTFNTIAAEAGCTPHELMALSGHKTLAEVTRYTAAADRKKLAAEGMRKIERRTITGDPASGFPETTN
jgi:integrase